MKRRGFLSALGIGGAAVATGAAALASTQDEGDRGIFVSLKCACREPWNLLVLLDRPITYGPAQCPRCLQVMAWPDDVAQRIKEWNIAHGHATTIYTPHRYG